MCRGDWSACTERLRVYKYVPWWLVSVHRTFTCVQVCAVVIGQRAPNVYVCTRMCCGDWSACTERLRVYTYVLWWLVSVHRTFRCVQVCAVVIGQRAPNVYVCTSMRRGDWSACTERLRVYKYVSWWLVSVHRMFTEQTRPYYYWVHVNKSSHFSHCFNLKKIRKIKGTLFHSIKTDEKVPHMLTLL